MFTVDKLLEEQKWLLEQPLKFCQLESSHPIDVDWQMLRLDALPEFINGNKGFKLFPHLLEAAEQGHKSIISFGGAHSNHLHALAYAAKHFGFYVVAVVRAYKEQPDTPTIALLKEQGVTIHYASKAEYLRRYDLDYWGYLRAIYPDAFVIPEGGSGSLGEQGSRLFAQLLEKNNVLKKFDYITVATGTGTFLKGLSDSMASDNQLLAFTALNNKDEISQKLSKRSKVEIFDQYTFGGFAKMKKTLADFIVSFEAMNKVSLDPVYTAKMCFGLDDLLQQGFFQKGSRILTIHSGGLQGRAAMQDKIFRLTQPVAVNDDGLMYDCA